MALIAHLPPDSATGRALGGGWTRSEHLAAATVDALAMLLWAYSAGHRGEHDPEPPRPAPIPRPGITAEDAAPPLLNAEELGMWLAGIQN